MTIDNDLVQCPNCGDTVRTLFSLGASEPWCHDCHVNERGRTWNDIDPADAGETYSEEDY